VANKYRLLATWLSEREVDQVTLTFDEIEGILGFPLPDSALKYPAFWFGEAVLDELHQVGWHPSTSVRERVVVFKKRPDLLELGQQPRRVALRKERSGGDSRFLDAWLDEDGTLHIDGQDLGPSTSPVSTDGEYEWFHTIEKADIPNLLRLLGEPSDSKILDVLERNWTGKKSYELEGMFRGSGIPLHTRIWSG